MNIIKKKDLQLSTKIKLLTQIQENSVNWDLFKFKTSVRGIIAIVITGTGHKKP
jgi:hypothetical protein